MTHKDTLKELKMLHNKPALNADEVENWTSLCASLNDGCFCEAVLEFLDRDQMLTHQLLNHINTTGNCIQQLAFAGVAMSLYLVKKLFPSCQDSLQFFDEFWIEPCEFDEQMVVSVNDAINRALDKMIAEANS